nr:peroxide stress-activated histidine kinase mak3 [Quercus suber]
MYGQSESATSNNLAMTSDEHTPYFLKRYFQRLHDELPEYEFSEDFIPFHSSYSNWHFFGKRRRRDATPTGADSGSRPESTRSYSNYTDTGSSTGRSDTETFVIARVSLHNLRLEREFKQCQQVVANCDPEARHFVRPILFIRLPARALGDEKLSVSLVEAPGRNYLRNMTSFGPNFYNGTPSSSSPAIEKVSLPCFLAFAVGATECLELLHHSENLVHGELRGDAFHFNRDTGAVRMVNFGSGPRSFAEGLTSAGWAGLIQERGVEHKLQFIAPEQTGRLGAAEPDARTDIYSLGILFWNMLAGQAAFEGTTPLDIMQAVLSRRAPPVTSVRPDVPDAIAAVISKMTAKQMDERYHSITGAKTDLLAIQKALEDCDHQALTSFRVGANDSSCFFNLPTHLIGRQEQYDMIVDVVERASSRSVRGAPVTRKGLYSLSSGSISIMTGERIDSQLLEEMMSESTSSGGAERDHDLRLNSIPEAAPYDHFHPGHPSRETAVSTGTSSRDDDLRNTDTASSHGSPASVHASNESTPRSQMISNESSSLLRTAQKLKRKGRTEIIVISGAAGSGKSSLVHAIAPVVRKRGYYASAKFDHVRNSPFDPVIKVMSSLFKQIFSEPDVSTNFHENIRTFVKPFWGVLHQSLELPSWLLSSGTNGRVDLAGQNVQHGLNPGFDRERKKYNAQSAQEWLRSGGSNKTSRFMHVYLDVLRLLALQKLIILSLDDLQFADLESHDLLMMIAASRIPVVIILTHRGEELLSPSMLRLLNHATKINIQAFTDDETGQYVADTLKRSKTYCLPLAAIIQEKTQGNPFFVKELLSLGYRNRCIYYCWKCSQWEFSIDKLFADFSSPDPGAYSSKNFILRKIRELPVDAQTVLAWASLIGNTFSFKLVQQVMSCECSRLSPPELLPPSSMDVVAGLQACTSSYMLVPTDNEDRFAFSHDRYITSADSLCDNYDREEMHYIIASSMMKHAPFDPVLYSNKILYEQARHICESIRAIKLRASIKAPYRQLLYQAAESAREDGARTSCVHYFRCCLGLLHDDPWDESFDDVTYVETLTVMTKAAEALLVVGSYDEAGVLLSQVHKHAHNATDQAPATILKSRIMAQMGRGKDAFLLLRKSLAELGSDLPQTSYEACDAEFQRLLPLVQEQKIETSKSLKSRLDHNTQTLGALMIELLSVSYWGDALLFYQGTLKLMSLFVERGVFAQIGLGFVHLASIAVHRFHLVAMAVELGHKAIQVLNEVQNESYTLGRGMMLHTLFLGHITSKWHDSLPALNKGAEAASSAGDKILHLLNMGVTVAYRVWASDNLVEVEALVSAIGEEYPDWAESARGGVILMAVRQFSRAMQGKTYAKNSADVLSDDQHSSDEYEKFLTDVASDPSRPLTIYHSYKLNALYRFGYYEEAIALGEKLLQYMQDAWCIPNLYQSYFYFSLALLARLREGSLDADIREKTLSRVAEYRSRIEIVASHNSVNYYAMLKILDAEVSDARENYGEVLHLYEAAINHATLHDCFMDCSLATELYGEWLARRGATRPSRGVVLDAISIYRTVGAFGKAEALSRRHEFLLLGTRSLTACDTSTQTDAEFGATTYQLDKMKAESALQTSADRTQEWLDPGHHAAPISGDRGKDPQASLSGGVSALGLDMIDLASILESSQLLSSELNVEKLLKRLTEIVVDSTSAELCGLVVEQDGGGWCVAAIGVPDDAEVPAFGMPLEDVEDPVAKQVTLYVLRFKDQVFVKNVLDDERFANVPQSWLEKNPGGASMIALPILHGDKVLLGSLYVQGGPNSFTERTVTLLKLLVNQIAISIANALLFKQVERVSARNASMLEVQKQALTQAREAEKKAKDAEGKAMENAKAKSMFLANVSHELRTP